MRVAQIPKQFLPNLTGPKNDLRRFADELLKRLYLSSEQKMLVIDLTNAESISLDFMNVVLLYLVRSINLSNVEDGKYKNRFIAIKCTDKDFIDFIEFFFRKHQLQILYFGRKSKPNPIGAITKSMLSTFNFISNFDEGISIHDLAGFFEITTEAAWMRLDKLHHAGLISKISTGYRLGQRKTVFKFFPPS